MSPRRENGILLSRGFSIVELIVSIAIIALLVAILLPAVQTARSRADALSCKSHLSQVGKAVHSYHATHNKFPVITNWVAEELQGHYDNEAPPQGSWPPLFRCPSDNIPLSHPRFRTSYWKNLGSQFGDRGWGFVAAVSSHKITDGLSNSACMSERLNSEHDSNGFPIIGDIRTQYHYVSRQWPDNSFINEFAADCRDASTIVQFYTLYIGPSYTHVLPPNGKSCYNQTGYRNPPLRFPKPIIISTPSSNHTGGVHLLMCDGAVRWASDTISMDIWKAVGSIAGGETEHDF